MINSINPKKPPRATGALSHPIMELRITPSGVGTRIVTARINQCPREDWSLCVVFTILRSIIERLVGSEFSTASPHPRAQTGLLPKVAPCNQEVEVIRIDISR